MWKGVVCPKGRAILFGFDCVKIMGLHVQVLYLGSIVRDNKAKLREEQQFIFLP